MLKINGVQPQANVVYLVSALEVILKQMGYITQAGDGVAAVSRVYADAAT